jgi:hypothetical protein
MEDLRRRGVRTCQDRLRIPGSSIGFQAPVLVFQAQDDVLDHNIEQGRAGEACGFEVRVRRAVHVVDGDGGEPGHRSSSGTASPPAEKSTGR